MRKSIIILLFATFLAACNNPETGSNEEPTTITTPKPKAKSKVDGLYKILKAVPNNALSKVNIDVELTHKTSKEELTEIAREIKSEWSGKKMVWIFYFIKGDTENAWAISHFKPELEVEILGATNDQTAKMKEAKVDGQIIGKWEDKRSMGLGLITIYEKESKLFTKFNFANGQSMEEETIKKKYQGLDRYEAKDNPHKEFQVVEKNGNLGMYGQDGKFTEAVKVK